jgi:hypothetical protein
MEDTCIHAIIVKKFYLGPKFGTLINRKRITIFLSCYRVETRRTTNLLPVLRRNLRLVLNLKLSAFTARARGTGSVTAQSIWRIRRTGRLTKVYMIYMLLMCTLLVVAIAPRYLILVRLLTYVTRNRG